MNRNEVKEQILQKKLIAIMRGLTADEAVDTAKALLDGGISLIEVTFDQKSTDGYQTTRESIRRISEEFSGRVLAGAGTVMSPEQVDMAKEAGAEYIITPNMDPEVIRRAVSQDLVMICGALTPTETADAYKYGSDFVKIFPAGDVGSGYIKAIHAPLSHIPLMAVGGVDENNMGEFLKAGVSGFGIGGSLIRKDLIRAGRFDEITKLAKLYNEKLTEGLK